MFLGPHCSMQTLDFSWFEQGPNFDGLSSSLDGDISVRYHAMS